jgi:hypothetical protein
MGELDVQIQWYTRRGGVIRGPFSSEEISRHLLLGRICMDDELSQNRLVWSAASQCSELLPDELRNLSSWDDYQQLVIARMQVDERKDERRCRNCDNRCEGLPERRTHADRRSMDDDRLLSQYLFGCQDSFRINATHGKNVRPLLLAMLLVTLVFAWLVPSQQ